jgi:hypothetical protein
MGLTCSSREVYSIDDRVAPAEGQGDISGLAQGFYLGGGGALSRRPWRHGRSRRASRPLLIALRLVAAQRPKGLVNGQVSDPVIILGDNLLG